MPLNYYTQVVADQDRVELLDGLAYRWFDYQTLNPLTSFNYLIEVPLDRIIIFSGREVVVLNSPVSVESFIDPMVTDDGISLDHRIINRNGTKPNQSLSHIWHTPEVTSNGVLVDYEEIAGSEVQGNRGSSGSATSQKFPQILPKGIKSLVTFTNMSETNPANFVFELFWSEIEEN